MADLEPISITGADGDELFPGRTGESIVDLDKLSHLVSYQGFIQQNLVYFRSRMRLSLVLGYILSFAIFCLIFFAKNVCYSGKHRIQPFPVSLSDFHTSASTKTAEGLYEYRMDFEVKEDIEEDVLIYYEYSGIYQSFNGFLLELAKIDPPNLEDVLKSSLGKRYPYLDNVTVTGLGSAASLPVTSPKVTAKYGRYEVIMPPTASAPAAFPIEWGTITYTPATESKFKTEHLGRFCQWLFPAPFKVATKILGALETRLKAGKYTFSLQTALSQERLAATKIYIDPISVATTSPELQMYLMLCMIVSFLISGFLLLMRYLFPKPQEEHDVVAGYRKKIRINL